MHGTIEALRESYFVKVLNHFKGPTGPVVTGSLRRNPLLYYVKLRRTNATIVHYHHAGRPSLLIATALAHRRGSSGRWVITVHNHSLAQVFRHSILGRVVTIAINRFDQVVAVSSEIGEMLQKQGVRLPIEVMPAYVGVEPSGKPKSEWKPEPFFDDAEITLVVSAYRITRWASSSTDLYGLDIAVETFLGVVEKVPNARLAIFLAHSPRGRWAKRYLNELIARIDARGATARIWIDEQLAPAFAHDVVYLRPTRTDGDAVSVREALDAGVEVIASDAVSRPAGVSMVPLDVNSFVTAALKDIERASKGTNKRAVRRPTSSSDRVRAFYRKQLALAAQPSAD